MYYERIGEGLPLVLLHGWCLSGAMWLYAVDSLRDEYELIVPDLPGFGRSSQMRGPFTLERYVDGVAELVTEAIIEAGCEHYSLVGFAFGADIALAAVARGPAVAPNGIVLAGITDGGQFPADRMIRSMRRDWPDFARRSAGVLTRRSSAATTAWLERIYAQTPLSVAADVAELLGEFEPTRLCPSIDVPALFVHGAKDDVAPIDVARRCVEQTTAATLAALDDAEHLVVLDQPAAFHDAVRDFVRSLPSARAEALR